MWACSATPPSKWSSRCLPRLSARSSTSPSSSAAGSPSGRRCPGVRAEILLPARRSSRRRASLRIESPSISLSGHELARLATETCLDQRSLHSGSDHRLAVEALDRELLDLTALSGLRQGAEGLDELAIGDLLQSQDALATSLDVEERLPAAKHHVSTRGAGGPALALELGPGEGGAVRICWIGGGEHQELVLSSRQAAQALDCTGQRELRSTQALHEVAAPSRPEQLEVLQLAVDRGEAAGNALGDGCLAGDDPVPLEHQLGERPRPRPSGGGALEQRRAQRPAPDHGPGRRRAAPSEPAATAVRALGGPQAWCAQRREGVVRHLAGPCEVPEGLVQFLRRSLQLQQVEPEAGALSQTLADRVVDLALDRVQLGVAGGRPGEPDVLSEVERHLAVVAPERPGADPDDLTAGAELVQPGGAV